MSHGTTHRLAAFVAACALAITSVLGVVRPAYADAALEYRIKSAFLYNFAKFVSWPDSAFVSDRQPLRICVVGRNPFNGGLAKALAGRTAQGHPVELAEPRLISDAVKCHVVFIPESEDERVAQILQTLSGRSVLTVGESAGFQAAGGMIRLLLENKKVRFDVNLAQAESAALRVSSQLLKLAREVER